ncbi:putative membrane protein YhhN [Povalibacter uvarum]|uniref:Putative membrane protein YhhN n=1 Tax=Povalibacter uvarum TaxID=732238 RepID=A0A841HSX7_9GAMM|nr:lysoplasmalogenase [Povalibacter uvarum]MBB6095320.1 putative membrane protein YhhN [Povalibacter uvarum]
MNATSSTRFGLLFFAAFAAGALYTLLLPWQPYPGSVVLKTAMCVLLAGYAWQAQQKLLVAALLCSAAGDAFLGIDGERLFVPGLASFLIAHVFYATIFVRSGSPVLSRRRKIVFAAIVAFAVGYATILWPVLGALQWPVTAYMTVITVMALCSLRMRSPLLPLGAILFMISDSLIALGKFLSAAEWLGPSVWITYAAAQLLLTYGLVGRPVEATITGNARVTAQ